MPDQRTTHRSSVRPEPAPCARRARPARRAPQVSRARRAWPLIAPALVAGTAAVVLTAARPGGRRASIAAAVVEYTLPRPNVFPHDPAVGPDGTVWFTDQANSYIGRLDPGTGKVT